MSPWRREEILAFVGPAHVDLVARRRLAGGLLGRRLLREVQRLSLPGQAGGVPWQQAVQGLARALPTTAGKGALGTVVLSNQFVRYLMVPWLPGLGDAREELAHARHCFARVHGKSGDDWEVRLGPSSPGEPRLACAVEPELLAAVRHAFAQSGLVLQSIQPHLMAAFNDAGRRLPQGSGWLVVLEPGHLCLCMLHRGRWVRVQGRRAAAGWHEDLVALLERQCFLGEQSTVPQDVYVRTVDGAEVDLPEAQSWRFHALGRVDSRSGHAPQPEAVGATATAG